jgi:hypothetical protein
MSAQQPYDDPRRTEPAYPQQAAPQQQQPYYGQGQMQPPVQGQRGYAPTVPQPGHQHRMQAVGKRYALRGAETFWYVLACIAIGSGYFAKLPAKKAASEILSELQLDGGGPSHGYGLRGAEGFWYVMECLAFGGGYFAKVYAKKGLWELITMLQTAPGQHTEAIFRALRGATAPAAY